MDNLILLLEELFKDYAKKRGEKPLEIREYQIDLAQKAFSAVIENRNSILDLPTGAGKTMIALFTSLLLTLSDLLPKKIIYLVPMRTLINQVLRSASWCNTVLPGVAITPDLVSKPQNLLASINENNLIVTTPGILGSALSRSLDLRNLLIPNTSAVIVDEFDCFLVSEPTDKSFSVRFDKLYNKIDTHIKKIPKLLMSGTSPSTIAEITKSSTAKSIADFIQRKYYPIHFSADKKEYKEFIPKASLKLTKITDTFVVECESAISSKIHQVVEIYNCKNNIELDLDYFYVRLKQIANGKLQFCLTEDGDPIRIDKELLKLAQTLLSLNNKYLFLYEDMFNGIQPIKGKVRLFIDCEPTGNFKDIFVLQDKRENSDEYHVSLKSKSLALLNIIKKRKEQKGVIFTRYIRLSDGLNDFLQGNDIKTNIVDGRIRHESTRYKIIEKFNSDDSQVLIMTRETGKRGLDLPIADYAIFYSPKSDEYAMWQELSRIRSTVVREKPTYLLFYADTTEEVRVRKLVGDMKSSSHAYSFSNFKI